jgi:hypothetical protein
MVSFEVWNKTTIGLASGGSVILSELLNEPACPLVANDMKPY